MLKKYQQEHNTKRYPDWKHFAQWAAKKIDAHSLQKTKHSSTYNVDYSNWFSQSFVGKQNLVSFSDQVQTKAEKIQEMIDYVEVIRAIANTDQSIYSS